MKATIIQLWALLCLLAQGFFELVCVLAQETANLFNQCGIEISMRNLLISLFYFTAVYLFVISVWIVLI